MSALVHTPGGARQLRRNINTAPGSTDHTTYLSCLGSCHASTEVNRFLTVAPEGRGLLNFTIATMSMRNVSSSAADRVRQGTPAIYAFSKLPRCSWLHKMVPI